MPILFSVPLSSLQLKLGSTDRGSMLVDSNKSIKECIEKKVQCCYLKSLISLPVAVHTKAWVLGMTDTIGIK